MSHNYYYDAHGGYHPISVTALERYCRARPSAPISVLPCAPGCAKPPNLLPADITAAVGKKAFSTSNVFNGPQTGQLELSLISLLQHSQTGNLGIHSVDIDVRTTETGVMLVRGNGSDVIYDGGSRNWQGSNDGMGLLGSATDFRLILLPGDQVVINWTEIKA